MKEKKHELKKHAATIHCANTLSLLQRKISNALLYHAYPELIEREEHNITMKQLCKIIGYHGHNYEAIKNSLKGLITTLVEWNVIDEESNIEDWTASTILASVRIKGPLCTYAYSPRMKELLHSPKIYGKINLIIQSKFQSSYGLALYENCIRYKGLPQTKWFDLTVFRKLMGVPDGKYFVFRDLKKRVIDKSVEEINAHSDLVIEVEFTKTARQVTKIRFKLKEKDKKVMIGKNIVIPTKNTSIQEKLMEIGVSQTQVEKILQAYQEDYIVEKLQMLKNYERLESIDNFPGYLLAALKNNFQTKKLDKSVHATNRPQNSIRFIQNEMLLQDENKKLYAIYINSFIDQKLKQLPAEELNSVCLAFEEHIKSENEFFREKYRKNGLKSEIIKNYYRNFLRMKYPQYVTNLLSYEEFVKKNNEINNN